MVDPDSINKDARYTEKFRVDVHFKNVCEKCTDSSRPINDLCKQCSNAMETDIKDSWNIIHAILDVIISLYLINYRNMFGHPMKRACLSISIQRKVIIKRY